MPRRQASYPLKERVRVGRPQKGQPLVEPFDIHLALDQTRCQYGLDLGSEDERAGRAAFFVHRRVIQRLDADVVAHERELPLTLIPDGESEHPVETRQALHAPFDEGREQHLRIRVRVKAVLLGLKLPAQLAIVIDFSIEDERKATITGEHRLVSRLARVYDRQPSVAQTCAPPRLIYQRGHPHTFIIAPAMLYRIQHRADARLWIHVDDSGN